MREGDRFGASSLDVCWHERIVLVWTLESDSPFHMGFMCLTPSSLDRVRDPLHLMSRENPERLSWPAYVMSSDNLPLVGKLLGHRRHRTTAGSAHLFGAHLFEAAEQVGTTIAQLMKARPS